MRIIISMLTIMLAISSCQSNNKRTVEGDLYFKLIDIQRFFDAPDSILIRIESSIKPVNKDTLSEQDKKIYGLLEFLLDKRLLRKPFIRIRQDNGEIIMVFLDSKYYDKIKDFNRNDLIRDNKKIRIRVEVVQLKFDSLIAYETVKLISIDKVDGKTYWDK